VSVACRYLRLKILRHVSSFQHVEASYEREEAIMQYLCNDMLAAFGIPYAETNIFKHRYKWRVAVRLNYITTIACLCSNLQR
jgi:hypothetical protein